MSCNQFQLCHLPPDPAVRPLPPSTLYRVKLRQPKACTPRLGGDGRGAGSTYPLLLFGRRMKAAWSNLDRGCRHGRTICPKRSRQNSARRRVCADVEPGFARQHDVAFTSARHPAHRDAALLPLPEAGDVRAGSSGPPSWHAALLACKETIRASVFVDDERQLFVRGRAAAPRARAGSRPRATSSARRPPGGAPSPPPRARSARTAPRAVYQGAEQMLRRAQRLGCAARVRW